MTSASQRLAGATFCITGTLPRMSRDEVKEFIRTRGGHVVEWLGKATSFLVAGERPGSKLDRARELGVAVLTEEELVAMGGGMDEGRREEKEREGRDEKHAVHEPHPGGVHRAPPITPESLRAANEATAREMVHSPKHYGGRDDPYEVIKVLRAWGHYDNAPRFNSIKYLARAGKKGDVIEDVEKAIWYAFEEIAEIKRRRGESEATLDSVARAWIERRGR